MTVANFIKSLNRWDNNCENGCDTDTHVRNPKIETVQQCPMNYVITQKFVIIIIILLEISKKDDKRQQLTVSSCDAWSWVASVCISPVACDNCWVTDWRWRASTFTVVSCSSEAICIWIKNRHHIITDVIIIIIVIKMMQWNRRTFLNHLTLWWPLLPYRYRQL